MKKARNELAGRNLDNNLKKFRAFHGRQKFRAAVKGIIAAKRFKEVLERLAESYVEPEEEEETVWENRMSDTASKQEEETEGNFQER